MSFFSKVGSAISSAYNTAKSYVSKALNYVSGAPSQAAAGGLDYSRKARDEFFGTRTSAGASGSWGPTMTPTPTGSNYMPSGQMDSGNNLNVSSLPVQISAGQQKVSGGGGGTNASQLYSSYGPVAPTTISAKNLGESINTSFGLGSLQQGGASTGAQALILNSSPGSINASGIDTTKLAGSMAGYYKRNPTTGVMEPVDDMSAKQNETDQQTADRVSKMMANLMPEKESVYNDPQVRQAQQRRYDIQQQLLAPTNELNAVIAKQNQDLLQLRQTGSKEGVTEAVYGGQSNAINYNAAIRALPLQASIAGLQGDLKLAQDYLTELTQIKTEQINNQYEYNKNLYNAISGAITEKDKRIYEEKLLANENARKDNLDLESFKEKIAFNAMQQGASPNITQRILNSSDKAGAIQAAGQYAVSPNTQITQLDNGNTVLVDKNTGKIISNIGGAKTPSTGNVAALTPEQANDPFIQKLAKSAGGKPITDTFAQQLNKGLTVLGQIGTLQTNIKDMKTGPIVGAFKGANPWDTNAQTIKAQLNAVVPNLARGVYGEVGVLTDNDIKNYAKTLPTLKSTEDIRNAVLGITVDLIGKSLKRNLEINEANGKDVSGFIDIYTEMQNTRNSIFEQIPGYTGTQSQSQTPVAPEIQSLRSKYNY